MGIRNNIEKFRSALEPYGARLVAVSKTHPATAIQEAYDAGQLIFGENKVQELTGKQPQLPSDIHWHFIGHLQRNKVKFIAPFVNLIHAVDSLRLLEELERQGQNSGKAISCLLQVFIAQEETKFGLSYEELDQLLADPMLSGLSHVKIEGLMGMATLTEDEQQIKREFAGLKNKFEELKRSSLPPSVHMRELSMGMSSDYRIALDEGSTLVRIGTAIFGERKKGV